MSTPTSPRIALLFPGQGSQTVGMGKAFYDASPAARAVFEEADDALGFALSKLIFEGPEDQLKLTEHTQPAILTMSIAAHRVLAPELASRGLEVAFAAGHSLGEYSANVAAGTFSFADAVRTVRSRGQFMQQAVPAGLGAMAAILGLDANRINDICASVSDELTAAPPATGPVAQSATVTDAIADPANPADTPSQAAAQVSAIVAPANLNSPDQTVISGSKDAVERAAALCKEAGAKRTVMLPVSAPFHCKLMQPAQDQLAATLESIAFTDPTYPVAANIDARLLVRGMEIRDALIRQVTGAVRWVECIQLLAASGATHYIEVGPGKVLSGLNRQIDRALATTNVEDPTSLDKTLAAFAPTED
ncbi:[acyl-carrier-protein] S-malonyltransferase [Bryocella elongata]|uniref:[acyl-carrier-protein] S-malonyltransferase n=1 Tax=Bryocella elongata TaxID=863522 RepID=A0A1H6BFA8_9BACT|nr:ACP S-malonyltransferase [Bryocella elongata]SEG59350.1 [acyl-carrier-protein] S-malonyltransferase [Bryocella elongata]